MVATVRGLNHKVCCPWSSYICSEHNYHCKKANLKHMCIYLKHMCANIYVLVHICFKLIYKLTSWVHYCVTCDPLPNLKLTLILLEYEQSTFGIVYHTILLLLYLFLRINLTNIRMTCHILIVVNDHSSQFIIVNIYRHNASFLIQ